MEIKLRDMVKHKPTGYVFQVHSIKPYAGNHKYLVSMDGYTFRIEDCKIEEPTNKTIQKYLVFVSGMANPKKIHTSLEESQKEAQRLAKQEASDVFVCEIVNKYGIEVKEISF